MKKTTAGFTLVELIVVIAILAILAGIAIPVYSGYIAKANEAADYQTLDAVKTAAVFAATDANIPSAVTVKTITVGTDAKQVTVTYEEGAPEGAPTTLNVSPYLGTETINYKSTTFASGATWSDGKWQATTPPAGGEG